MLKTWGRIPEYGGKGRPPTACQPGKDWQYLQVIKKREGRKLVSVTTKVIYGDSEKVKDVLGEHTAYVERTNLTSRQMNGRLVRKTLSYSKQVAALEASCAWEDWVSNLTRPLKTLAIRVNDGQRRWQPQPPAMEAGLTDHQWTIKELLLTVVAPAAINMK